MKEEWVQEYLLFLINSRILEKGGSSSMAKKMGLSASDIAACSEEYMCSLNNVFKIRESCNYTATSKEPGWVEAMDKELRALEENGTWELTDLPKGKKIISSKWVFKTKYKRNGEVERLKAKVVARWEKQIKGKDYKDTFSPMTKFITVRSLIALATTHD